jgi:hypothetical protein
MRTEPHDLPYNLPITWSCGCRADRKFRIVSCERPAQRSCALDVIVSHWALQLANGFGL